MKFIKITLAITLLPWVASIFLLVLKMFGILNITFIQGFAPLWIPLLTCFGAILLAGSIAILLGIFSEK